ncbi:MAG: DNA polymerase III subunit delta [Anaerolineae bacterium]|nr:DNA polymerase III subunit delta [Anaerolineae bacterium]
MFYIFHGDDQFGLSEELARLRGQLAEGDPLMGDLNTSILDGQRITFGELRHVTDAMPFMAERRLIIVHGLLARLVPPGKGQTQPELSKFVDDLAGYLPHLPETTRLIFCEQSKLPASHPVLKVAREEGKRRRGFIRAFELPKERDLPAWIRARATDKGGQISNEAVAVLAALVGTDLRMLDQEIEKLLLYAGGRMVSSDDVTLLVSHAREASIFDLVDCVGARQTSRALQILHRLIDDGAAPLYVLAMIARQIRILIQIKDLADRRMTGREIADELHLHPFVVEKGLKQVRNFEMDQLEAAHEKLVDTDWAIKTGKSDDLLALDALIVALTRI